MPLDKKIIHINPGETKAEFYDEIGSCFGCCPNIYVAPEPTESLEDRIENFATVVEKTLVGKTLTNVCSYIHYGNFDNSKAAFLNDLDRRVVPFRIGCNIILVVEGNILYIDSGEEYASMKLNCEGIDAIESEYISPIEFREQYGDEGAILDISWGFNDLLNVKVKDAYISYCCGSIDGMNILLDNNFVFYIPLCSMEPIDCFEKNK